MQTFQDLQFKPHPNFPDTGKQALHEFKNGYAVSVVQFPYSYGVEDGLYEMAVGKIQDGKFHLDYTTPITSYVLGHLSEKSVTHYMQMVEML